MKVELRSWGLLLPGCVAILAGCSFRGGGNNPGDGDGDGDIVDAAPDGPQGTLLCDPITIKLQSGGADVPLGDIRFPLTVGDSIAFNAGASCSPTGNITFSWTFPSGDFVVRDGGSKNQFFIEVYPDRSGDRVLTLTIDDGVSSPISENITIATTGFQALDLGNGSPVEVRETAFSNDRVWLATDSGAQSQTLNNIGNTPYALVNDDAAGGSPTAAIPNDVSDVAYDGDSDVVTFLAAGGAGAYFFDRGADDITTRGADETSLNGVFRDALPIAGGGVRLLTAMESETSDDTYTTFTTDWNQATTSVVINQGADLLAGGTALFRFVDADNSDTLEIFNQGNNDDDGIAVMFVDKDGKLWIGSGLGAADTGIGVIDDFDDNTVTEHLLDLEIRAIAQDANGDMWVATEAGIRRFKADWGVWIPLGTKHGLVEADVKTLVVDADPGRNQILVGTSADLYRLRRQ